MAAIASHLGLNDSAAKWTEAADNIQNTLLEKAWSEKRGSFAAAFDGEDLDASVLLLPEIGLIDIPSGYGQGLIRFFVRI